MIRPPDRFGNHEANAELRYVSVYEILPDPDPEVPDDFPEPYQPVQVKLLKFTGYVPASSGIVVTDNSDIVIRTTKSGKKHGERGNGIDVTFAIDGGITPNAQATFTEATDVLAVKVKNASVTWEEAQTAVALVLDGAFSLVATAPGAAVGSDISDGNATLAGGIDGSYEFYGTEFGIGDHDTKDEAAVGDRFWIIYRVDAARWDIVGGGASVGLERFGYVTEALTGATSLDIADAGVGLVQFVTDAGADDGDPVEVLNRYYSGVPVGAPGWCENIEGIGWVAKNFDCRTAP